MDLFLNYSQASVFLEGPSPLKIRPVGKFEKNKSETHDKGEGLLLYARKEETLSQVRNMSGKIRKMSGQVRNM